MKRRKDLIMDIALKKRKPDEENESEVLPISKAIENNENTLVIVNTPGVASCSDHQIEMELPASTTIENLETSSSIIENTPERENEIHWTNTSEDDNESIKNIQTFSGRPRHETRVSCSSRSSSTSSSSTDSSNSSASSSSSSEASTVSTSQYTEIIQPDVTRANATVSTTQAGICTRKGRVNNVQSYCISPVNALESDPDLSDDDPTFQSHNEALVHLRSSSSSSSASVLQEISNRNEPQTTPRQSRKRKRDPAGWKQNMVKMLRNTGKAYQSLSKSKKIIPARSMKGPCTCRLKCSDQINESNRTELFKSYWKLGNLEVQRTYIRSCMMEIKPKYRYTNAQKPRLPNAAFFFTVNGQRIRVCKTYFMNTLDITDRQIRTIKSKTSIEGFILEDQRGKHDHKKKIEETVIQDIKNHINSIPRIESHYLRENTTREFIDGGKTIRDLWRDFSKTRNEQNKPVVDYWLYYDVFTTKFNIGFFQPKKDRCDLCMEYEMASIERKEQLKKKYDDHLKEKVLCRLEKLKDRKSIGDGNICVVYDLQAIMQCPMGDSSSFFYISKLNCLNFTMAELSKKVDERTNQNENAEENSREGADVGAYGNVFNYFWDETQGKRGANEIGSCVLDYLKKVSDKYPDKTLNITFYSDNCCGQNKNKFIACLYSYAVSQFPNIESITHKFLIRGHTQNEGDNVHSLIEKEIKRNRKSGPIYTAHQYVALIKNAKKTGNPFKVQELSYDFFIDLKSLHDQWGYNFNEDDERKSVLWNDVRVLKCLKHEPFTLFFKTSFAQEDFRRVNMRNKRKRMPSLEEVSIPKVFTGKIKLNENKKKGLGELLRKNLIPGFYTDYYKSLLDD